MRPLTLNQECALKALLQLETEFPDRECFSTKFIADRCRPNVTVSTMKSLTRRGVVDECEPYGFNKPFVEDPPGDFHPIEYSEIPFYRKEGIDIAWIPTYARQWRLTEGGRTAARAS